MKRILSLVILCALVLSMAGCGATTPATPPTIQEIIADGGTWSCQGGIENPYDTYYFDSEKMLFINDFESSKYEWVYEFAMTIVDDQTVRVDGIRKDHPYPATITVISKDQLRIEFLNDGYNNDDYFLNRKP